MVLSRVLEPTSYEGFAQGARVLILHTWSLMKKDTVPGNCLARNPTRLTEFLLDSKIKLIGSHCHLWDRKCSRVSVSEQHSQLPGFHQYSEWTKSRLEIPIVWLLMSVPVDWMWHRMIASRSFRLKISAVQWSDRLARAKSVWTVWLWWIFSGCKTADNNGKCWPLSPPRHRLKILTEFFLFWNPNCISVLFLWLSFFPFSGFFMSS